MDNKEIENIIDKATHSVMPFPDESMKMAVSLIKEMMLDKEEILKTEEE